MQILLIIAGGFVGLWLADVAEELLGLVAGALIGYLFAQRHRMQGRIKELTEHMVWLSGDRKKTATLDEAPSSDEAPREPHKAPGLAVKPAAVRQPITPPVIEAVDEPAVTSPKLTPERPAKTPPKVPPFTGPPQEPYGPSIPTPLDKALAAAKQWLTTGNVPVKIGVIVSFFGVAFLLKYAVDQRMLRIPIEFRYLGIALGACALLGFGWKLRNRMRVYALSLQGGGIGILFLTIFAAFRLHPLLPAPFAFFLLVALTASAGILAVLQNSPALAVLGIVGGFLAPVLISTGSGNHIALFSYYLLLNAAILGISWFKAWRFLNIIGFVFTFGVGTMWGYKYYKPELAGSTEPFLIAFFLFYQAIAILYAFRQPPKLRGLVDGTLIFGTPVIAFALQSRLMEGTEYGLAISAIAVAVFYTLVAVWLHRSQGRQMRLLIESYIALGVAFATIAIPLALDDRWTAVAWALEGAALVWVGVRQKGILARLTGSALLGASGVAFVKYGWTNDMGMPVLNGNLLGGMSIAVASLFSSRYLAADKHPIRMQGLLSVGLLIWGIGWWGSIGTLEIVDRVPVKTGWHVLTAFFAISVGLLAWIAKRYDWTAARWATLSYLPLLFVVALFYMMEYDHFFAGFGILAWAVAMIAHFGLLRAFDNGSGKIEGLWHFAGALLLVGLFSYETVWRMLEADFSDVWSYSAALLIPLFGATLIVYAREYFAWPMQRYWNAYLAAAGVLIGMQLLMVCSAGLDNPGHPEPLPYVPVLNPFDVLTIVGLIVALRFVLTVKSTTDWLDDQQYRAMFMIWGAAAFVLSTISVVRGVHHFGGIPWGQSSLMSSVSVQSALSIYWAILGFGGMIWGHKHANRGIWITGTALMALVVVKLFLIDLGNTGTVARIVSFLGVGVLLLVVGYLAPAPPKKAADEPVLADE